MIQRSNLAVEVKAGSIELKQEEDWKSLLKQSRMSSAELLQAVGLPQHPLADPSAEQLFELRVPRPYLDKIETGNPDDPLLLQVLPQALEHLETEGYSTDPLAEQAASPVPGLIHKYRSRVLLITTRACAIHCRYCFRRHFPYGEHQGAGNDWQQALDYIRTHPEVNEVILSGGDPLVLPNNSLKALLQSLDGLVHVKRIRIHSRLVTTLPQRVDRELLTIFSSLEKRLLLVTHCNHPNELGEDVLNACSALRDAGVSLFNQAVLLRQINDCPKILAKLSEDLFDGGIQPYYLFTMDPVAGAAHFDLEQEKVREIYRKLLALLPGFLVPRLVSEHAGQASKTPLDLGLSQPHSDDAFT